jgi:hypothetical protein
MYGARFYRIVGYRGDYCHSAIRYGYAAMFRYAWVGGSIWGITFGGIIVMIIGTVLFRNMSKRCKGNLK